MTSTTISSSTSTLQSQIERASRDDFKSIELVHLPHPKWPNDPNNPNDPIHISILDSSFNPPTKAHFAISSAPFPPITLSNNPKATQSQNPSVSPQKPPPPPPSPIPYTARLLLFSARNVEKKPKMGDATIAQRVEMMKLQAAAMGRLSDVGQGGVAVGLINEATFVGKSRILRKFLGAREERSSTIEEETNRGNNHEKGEEDSEPKITLTFLIGTDTLVRFFDPRYYPPGEGKMQSCLEGYFSPPPNGDGSFLVSARRGKEETDRAIEEEILRRAEVVDYVQSGKVRLLGDANEGWETISSTVVRDVVKSYSKAEGMAEDMEEAKRRLEGLCLPSIATYIFHERLYLD